jgi:glycosyltransferase involved in cell wall biosynthesis
MKKPTVSVLMTVYNREHYISEAIESVLDSSFKDFELIIVDDCSADGSVAIARKYEKTDLRVRVFINNENIGDYPNRNQAASYARGKYLKYVDADDLIYPWGLEILVNSMEKYPDAGWGLCSLNQNEHRIYPFKLNPDEIINFHFQENSLFHKAGLSSIIRKDIFDRAGRFSGKRHLGDFELWLRLSQISPIVLMPHGIVWYRTHEEQESQSNRTDEYIPLKYEISMLKFIKNNPVKMDLGLKEKIINDQRKKILKKYLKFTLKLNWKNASKILIELKRDIETFS